MSDDRPDWVSIRAVAWVLDEAPVSADLIPVLIAIARRCDEDGKGSFQSNPTLSLKTGKSDDQVGRDIKKLLADGLIVRSADQSLPGRYGVPAGKWPTVYDVVLTKVGPKPKPASKNPTGRKKAATPCMDATPGMDAGGGMDATPTPCMDATGTPRMEAPQRKPLNNPMNNPSSPYPFDAAADIVEGELVEEGEEDFASQEQRIKTLTDEIAALPIRKDWKRADITKHVRLLVEIVDGEFDMAAAVARETAADPDTDFPARISHRRNPHLKNARQVRLFARMDALDAATGADEPEPGTHPYEPGSYGICAVPGCDMPEFNAQAHGRKRHANTQPRTSTRALPHNFIPDTRAPGRNYAERL